jgi:hypothetical protein
MKRRMCGAVLLCVMVLVGAVACSSGASKAPNGVTGSEILTMANNATASINTLQGQVTMNMIAMGEEMNYSSSTSMDISNRTLYESETDAMYINDTDMTYILNNWVYEYNPGVKAEWVRTPLTEDIWSEEYQPNAANQTLALLNFPTAVQYIGQETVAGTNCYKINVNPNPAVILGALDMSDYGSISPSDVVKSSSCTVWIDESTYYPLKISIDMTISTVLLNVVSTISNINQPVNIVLPAAAKNATAINYSTFESGNW